MRRVAVLLVVALTAALASGCSIKTLGAPTGSLKLTATFDDTQQLVTGHSVQLSDVKVGSVTSVKLRKDYKSLVTMSIKDAYRIPQGTSAEIKVTSLLGENFVQLTLPPGTSMATGPFMRSGEAIQKTSVQPAFEQVVGKAGPLLKALSGEDIANVVDAGATALGGNGDKLNATVAKSGTLIKVFADQRAELGAAVDQFARLGRSLANGKDQLGQAPVELQRTTRLLNDNKYKIIAAVQKLTTTARLLNDKVLEGRVVRLKTLIRQLDPVLKLLAGDRARLSALVDGLEVFTRKLPKATYDGQLLLYPLLRIVLPDGTVFPPQPNGKKNSLGGGSTPRPDPVPKGVRDAMPNVDDILGRP